MKIIVVIITVRKEEKVKYRIRVVKEIGMRGGKIYIGGWRKGMLVAEVEGWGWGVGMRMEQIGKLGGWVGIIGVRIICIIFRLTAIEIRDKWYVKVTDHKQTIQ